MSGIEERPTYYGTDQEDLTVAVGGGLYPHACEPTTEETSTWLGEGFGNESAVIFSLIGMELSDLRVMADAALKSRNAGRAGMVAGVAMMRGAEANTAGDREATLAAYGLAATIIHALEPNPAPLPTVSELYN